MQISKDKKTLFLLGEIKRRDSFSFYSLYKEITLNMPYVFMYTTIQKFVKLGLLDWYLDTNNKRFFHKKIYIKTDKFEDYYQMYKKLVDANNGL